MVQFRSNAFQTVYFNGGGAGSTNPDTAQTITLTKTAGARANVLSYSRLIAGLKKANVEIDRKVLADLAMNEQQAFTAVVEKAKASL